jgi:hypothetical protein
MGIVYKARQKALDRLVAIKILAGEWQQEPGFAERFSREARTLAKLAHPHIVTVHDFGEAGGLYYLVMEFIDGVNLRDLLRDGRLEPPQALAIVPPVCEALQYAHSRGVVHRDIKPENLLLDREGRVKIADFGIAMLAGDDPDASGTPAYMAPEQGRADGEIDHRTDIYALGVVLYEMLTGERPTGDDPPAAQILVDVRIDEIVLRALASRPEMRFQSAAEMGTAVRTVVAIPQMGSGARPTSVDVSKVKMSKWAIAGFIWLLIGLSGWTMGLARMYPQAVYRELLDHFVPASLAPRHPEERIRKSAKHSLFPEPAPGSGVPAFLALFVLVAIPGPIGGTVCGWIAYRRIRGSRGSVYGLGLALFDALLIPFAIMAIPLAYWFPQWDSLFRHMPGYPGSPIMTSGIFPIRTFPVQFVKPVLTSLLLTFWIGAMVTRGVLQPRTAGKPFIPRWALLGATLACGAIWMLPLTGAMASVIAAGCPKSWEPHLWNEVILKFQWKCAAMMTMAIGATICGLIAIRSIRNRRSTDGLRLAVGVTVAFPVLLQALLLWWGWSRLLAPLEDPDHYPAWAPWLALITATPVAWALICWVRRYAKASGGGDSRGGELAKSQEGRA